MLIIGMNDHECEIITYTYSHLYIIIIFSKVYAGKPILADFYYYYYVPSTSPLVLMLGSLWPVDLIHHAVSQRLHNRPVFFRIQIQIISFHFKFGGTGFFMQELCKHNVCPRRFIY